MNHAHCKLPLRNRKLDRSARDRMGAPAMIARTGPKALRRLSPRR